MSPHSPTSRRRFLASLAGFPFFWRRPYVTLAGIRFRRYRREPSRHRYLLIHGDESTAREVLTDFMKYARGVAFLVSNGTRTVPFDGGELDPNRMFSAEGARKNLRALNPGWTERQVDRAVAELDRGRPALLRALAPPPGGRIVTLHNNAHGYSMEDELAASDRTALHDRVHPREFMLCTDPGDFERLARGGYNVLLQKNGPPEDDGSLSRLAAREGFRYVNIEAALGEKDKQRRMLDFLESSLP